VSSIDLLHQKYHIGIELDGMNRSRIILELILRRLAATVASAYGKGVRITSCYCSRMVSRKWKTFFRHSTKFYGGFMKNSMLMFALVSPLFATAAYAQGPTDAEIAAIVVTANQVDIDAGKLAESKASNPDVKAYGHRMATDHADVNKQAVELVTKLKVTPKNNPTSESLKAGGEKNMADLKKLSGTAFDKAYIDHEVAYHQQVLDAVDKTLIPSAKNEELKALLIKVRPAFVSHLEHAKQVQSTLK
jgi:putative membrane protein